MTVPTPEQIDAMTPSQRKTYTALVRRIAARQLLTLQKSRRRDPLAWDFGTWRLVDAGGNTIASGTLPDMHRHLVDRPR